MFSHTIKAQYFTCKKFRINRHMLQCIHRYPSENNPIIIMVRYEFTRVRNSIRITQCNLIVERKGMRRFAVPFPKAFFAPQ